jgi:hypothetical protein
MNDKEKIQQGLLEGNLRHMVERVAGFKKAKVELEKAGKARIVTKETIRQENEAKELEKFMDFCNIFGDYNLGYCRMYREAGMISAPKEFKYDIYEHADGTRDIKYRNIRIWWPMRILQQLYGQQNRRIILAT